MNTPTPATATELAPLTDRVNNQPDILKGLSASEVVVALVVSGAVFFLVGGLLALLTGRVLVLFAALLLGPIATVWVGAGWLAGVKRNRPSGYYWQAFRWWLHRIGLWRVQLIDHNGPWDLGRSLGQCRARTPRSRRRFF